MLSAYEQLMLRCFPMQSPLPSYYTIISLQPQKDKLALCVVTTAVQAA